MCFTWCWTVFSESPEILENYLPSLINLAQSDWVQLIATKISILRIVHDFIHWIIFKLCHTAESTVIWELLDWSSEALTWHNNANCQLVIGMIRIIEKQAGFVQKEREFGTGRCESWKFQRLKLQFSSWIRSWFHHLSSSLSDLFLSTSACQNWLSN